jgi:peptide/nickel transport system substrate-binding protein
VGVAGSCLALGVVAAGCGGGSSTSSASSLRIGTTDDIDTLNPFDLNSFTDLGMARLLFPYLVEYAPNGQVVPSLATKWTASSDGKRLTFALRTGTTWSDGKPLTAIDVAYSFKLYLKYESSIGFPIGTALPGMVSVDATGPTTVVINYDERLQDPLEDLAMLPILPQQVWSHHDSSMHALEAYGNSTPFVSGGPFTPTKFSFHNIVLFARNPHYYGPAPKVASLGIEQFSNADVLTSALDSGGIDAVTRPVPATARLLSSNPNLRVQTAPGMEEDLVYINDDSKQAPELRDPSFRAALDLAINRDQINSIVYGGYLEPSTNILGEPSRPFLDPSIVPRFDLNAANTALDAAGYKRGPGGIRMYNGKPITLTMFTVNTTAGSNRTFGIIQSAFARLGITLTGEQLDANAALSEQSNGSYELGIFNTSAPFDPSLGLSQYTCPNTSYWCEKQYGALYNEQLTAGSEQARVSIVQQMQRILANNTVVAPLGFVDALFISNKQWRGFKLFPDGPLSYLSAQGLLGATDAVG